MQQRMEPQRSLSSHHHLDDARGKEVGTSEDALPHQYIIADGTVEMAVVYSAAGKSFGETFASTAPSFADAFTDDAALAPR